MTSIDWLVTLSIGVWCAAGCAVLVQFGLWLKFRPKKPMAAMRSGERRGAARFSYAAHVTLRPTDDRAAPREARATNISNAGIYVIAPWVLSAGTPIACELPTANGRLVRTGRVARVAPTSPTDFGMGIAFEDVSLIDEAGSRRPLTLDVAPSPLFGQAPAALA